MSDGENREFTAVERVVLDLITDDLHSRGWASHVTVEWLLSEWQNLSSGIGQYQLTIDDYTNDLCARDGLAISLLACSEPLRTKLASLVERADSEFISQTTEDVGGALNSYYRVDDASSWWWKRKPVTGALAQMLA